MTTEIRTASTATPLRSSRSAPSSSGAMREDRDVEALADEEREYGQPNEHEPSELLFAEGDVVAILAERIAQARREAWDEGYSAARTMAHCWGHTDHWENEPDNPYRATAFGGEA